MTMDTCAAKGHRAAAAAVLVLGVAGVLAGCSSGGGSGSSGSAPSTSARPSASASAPAQAAPAPVTSAPGVPDVTSTASARPVGNRPADPCSVLTDDQVTRALAASAPLRAEGASTEVAWGCTWGSRQSFVSIKELDATRFTAMTTDDRSASSPVPGAGDDAVLLKDKEDGRMPKVVFTVAGHHYSIEAVADRRELGAVNAAQEAAVEQQLAATAARALAG
ncbi:hypothetical protein AB0C76_33810 [Kitasatospora sp. NPDC048722]|uniref:hypothetical protein n=1 Tax=Kitasatospora sp. NPDC048722 TaxID=3155639 RepID=UPI0033E967DA